MAPNFYRPDRRENGRHTRRGDGYDSQRPGDRSRQRSRERQDSRSHAMKDKRSENKTLNTAGLSKSTSKPLSQETKEFGNKEAQCKMGYSDSKRRHEVLPAWSTGSGSQVHKRKRIVVYGERTPLNNASTQQGDTLDTVSVDTASVAKSMDAPMLCTTDEAGKRKYVLGSTEEATALGGTPQSSEAGEIMDEQHTPQPRRPSFTPSWPTPTPRVVGNLSSITLETSRGNIMLATETRDTSSEPPPPPPDYLFVRAKVGTLNLGGNGLEGGMQKMQKPVTGKRPIVAGAARRIQQSLPAVSRAAGNNGWDAPPHKDPSLSRLGTPTCPAAERIPTAPAAMKGGGASKIQNSAVSNIWYAPGAAPSTRVDAWETPLDYDKSDQPKYLGGTTNSKDMSSTQPTAASNIPAAEISTSCHHTTVWDTAPTGTPPSSEMSVDVDLTSTGFRQDGNGWSVAFVPNVSSSTFSVRKTSPMAATATAQDDGGCGITSGQDASTGCVLASGAPTSGGVSAMELFASTSFQDDDYWAFPSVPEKSISPISVPETSVSATPTPLSVNKAQKDKLTGIASSAKKVKYQDPDLLRLAKRRAEAARRERKTADKAKYQGGPQTPKHPSENFTAKRPPPDDKVITDYKGQELNEFCAKKFLGEIQHPELSSNKQYPVGSPGREWHKRQKDITAYIAKLMEENGIKTEADLATAIKKAQMSRHVESTPVLRKRQVEAERKLFELKQKKKKKKEDEASTEKARHHAASEKGDARRREKQEKAYREKQGPEKIQRERTIMYGQRSRKDWILLNPLSDHGNTCGFAARNIDSIAMNLVQIDMSGVKPLTAEEVPANTKAYATANSLDPRIKTAAVCSRE